MTLTVEPDTRYTVGTWIDGALGLLTGASTTVPVAPEAAPDNAMTEQQVDLLQRSLDYITEHPEEHNQGSWGRCLAHHVTEQAGHIFSVSHCDCCQPVLTTDGRHVRDVAKAELGLCGDQASRLFHGRNSVNLLWELAGEFSGGRVHRGPHL